MSRSRVRGVLSALVAVVLIAIPGAALATQPTEQFHDHFTETFSIDDFCGFAVDAVLVITDNFFLYADDTFTDLYSQRQTFTNPLNGRSVTVTAASRAFGDSGIVDEEAGTITFVTTLVGLQETVRTDQQGVLLRDAGIITFTDTFDLATDEFISSSIEFTGPHPDAAGDFLLFCDVVTKALT